MRLAGPHKAAVLDFAWHNSLIVSGDKNGVVAFWVRPFGNIYEMSIGYQ